MDRPCNRIAAVQGARSAIVQKIFRDLVIRWRPVIRIAGVIEESHGLEGRACSAGVLRSIADGELYPIFQDLGPGSTACHLEGAGVICAGEAVRRHIAAGCDLVVLSKFGKLEAAGLGLMAAFSAAFESHVPLLTFVSPSFHDAWAGFVTPLAVVLPAKPAAADEWLRSVRAGHSITTFKPTEP